MGIPFGQLFTTVLGDYQWKIWVWVRWAPTIFGSYPSAQTTFSSLDTRFDCPGDSPVLEATLSGVGVAMATFWARECMVSQINKQASM